MIDCLSLRILLSSRNFFPVIFLGEDYGNFYSSRTIFFFPFSTPVFHPVEEACSGDFLAIGMDFAS
jgi:hypothetical protein